MSGRYVFYIGPNPTLGCHIIQHVPQKHSHSSKQLQLIYYMDGMAKPQLLGRLRLASDKLSTSNLAAGHSAINCVWKHNHVQCIYVLNAFKVRI